MYIQTRYAYDLNQQLEKVSQSDGSVLSFYYDSVQPNKLQRIQIGSDSINTYTFAYQNHSTVCRDASGTETKLLFDDQGQALSFSLADELTQYRFNSAGQIEVLTHADGSEERFTYDTKQGLLAHHTHRDKTATTFHYSEDALPLLVAKTEAAPLSHVPARTFHYVYDKTFRVAQAVLRYEISPTGRVKEYEWNERGLIENERTYLTDIYPLTDGHPIDLQVIE